MAPEQEKLQDELIGKNLAKLRGPWTQARLAQMMATRGFQWTQSTVSAVESGTRSLKFTEAVELAAILGATYFDLLDRNIDELTQIRESAKKALDAEKRVFDALSEFVTWRLDVAARANAHENPLQRLDELRVLSIVERSVPDLIDEYRLDSKSEFTKNSILAEDHAGSNADLGPFMAAHMAALAAEAEWAYGRRPRVAEEPAPATEKP